MMSIEMTSITVCDYTDSLTTKAICALFSSP